METSACRVKHWVWGSGSEVGIEWQLNRKNNPQMAITVLISGFIMVHHLGKMAAGHTSSPNMIARKSLVQDAR